METIFFCLDFFWMHFYPIAASLDWADFFIGNAVMLSR
jgi:hypothetical protein